MRKFITSSVFILLFSMVSGQVFAGDKSACSEFKDIKTNPEYKGLYGLCVAYQNALFHEDKEAMEDIFQNWEKKVGDGGLPELPNHFYGGGAECPCWTTQILTDSTEGFEGVYCASSADHDEVTYLDNVPFFESGLFAPETGYCVMEIWVEVDGQAATVFVSSFTLDVEQTEVCRAGVQALQASKYEDGSSVFTTPCS